MRKMKIQVTMTIEADLDERGLSQEQRAAIVSKFALHDLCHSLSVQAIQYALHTSRCNCFQESFDTEGNLFSKVTIHTLLPTVPLVDVKDLFIDAARKENARHDIRVKDTSMAQGILTKLLNKPKE